MVSVHFYKTSKSSAKVHLPSVKAPHITSHYFKAGKAPSVKMPTISKGKSLKIKI